MLDFRIFGDYTVQIRGDLSTDIGYELSEYYQLLTTDNETETDIVCQIEPVDTCPTRILGDPEDYYAREDGRFIIKKFGGELLLDTTWDTITCSPTASRFLLSKLIEFKARVQLQTENKALIHASGIDIDGTTIVFPAWRHTGKTNTIIPFLQRGADYLSDDRVWVKTSGRAYGYPLPVNMLSYNYDSYPNLRDLSLCEKIRDKVSRTLAEKVERKRSLADEALYFFNRDYLGLEDGEYRILEEMIPQSGYKSEAEIDKLVFLQTVSGSEVSIEEMSEKTAVDSLYATSYYEWNKDLKEYCTAFDMLFPDESKTAMVEQFMQQELKTFRELVANVDILQLNLPREEQWREKQIVRQVQQALSEQLNEK